MSPVINDKFDKHKDETIRIGIDFGPWLASGETLSSPSIVSNTPSGLTISNVQINSTQFDDKDGQTSIAANEGVIMNLSEGSADTTYKVIIKATNSNGVDLPAVTQPIAVTD